MLHQLRSIIELPSTASDIFMPPEPTVSISGVLHLVKTSLIKVHHRMLVQLQISSQPAADIMIPTISMLILMLIGPHAQKHVVLSLAFVFD